jgi:uncharacterized protein (TIGR03435 family)
LIPAAYGVSLREVIGGPDWIDSPSSRFAIEAKAENPSNVSKDNLRHMLQTLLKERFQLVVHREKLDASGFALLMRPSGLKPKEASNQDGPSQIVNGAGTLIVRGTSMEGFAGYLSTVLSRPVSNETNRQEGTTSR